MIYIVSMLLNTLRAPSVIMDMYEALCAQCQVPVNSPI